MKTTVKNLPLALLISLSFGHAQAQEWLLAGNGSTSPTTDYVGTSDNVDLVIRTNATERLRITGGGDLSIASGGNLGIGITTPTYLLDVNGGDINLTNDANFYRIQGREALYFDGSNNLMVGTAHGAGLFSGAIRNTMVGLETGLALTSGDYNVFLGNQSGRAFTTGKHCTFSGYQSGLAVTTGEYNSFFGSQSGPNVTTGTRNTFMGYCAGGNLTVGERNVFLGHQAGADLTFGRQR